MSKIKPRQEFYTGPTDIIQWSGLRHPKFFWNDQFLEPLSLAVWDPEKIWSSPWSIEYYIRRPNSVVGLHLVRMRNEAYSQEENILACGPTTV